MATIKGNKNPTTPSDPVSAYGYFSQHLLEHEKKNLGGAFDFTEFNRKGRLLWNQLDANQQQYFKNLAAQDKKRHRLEMESYLLRVAEEKNKKPKKVKDPNAPKKPLSAFVWFCKDERPRVKEMHPDLTFADISKEVGRLWRDASADRKSRYHFMAQRDKERYQQEMATYSNSGTAGYAIVNPGRR